MKLTKNIYLPKYIMILSYLNYNNKCIISDIIYNNKITFAHVHKLIKELESFNILTKTKKGRKCIITLTNHGLYLSELCKNLDNELHNIKKYNENGK